MTTPERRMVLVIFTPAGFEDMRPLMAACRCPVWVSAGVMREPEIIGLRAAGADLTVFSSRIDPSDDAKIANVLAIVAEHHPEDRLWVEFQAAPPTS